MNFPESVLTGSLRSHARDRLVDRGDRNYRTNLVTCAIPAGAGEGRTGKLDAL
ncbi:Uncharacterised protein [Amycolatopsis camponoti]|uniref:Uncharacterized protein n=1 Tax=Amycolatopsis camponoti TaxID=2606593 RepID=A0A6I8LXR3_9PSEU|nr:Uncharacterised protein [Amycolatopsis camponoti]